MLLTAFEVICLNLTLFSKCVTLLHPPVRLYSLVQRDCMAPGCRAEALHESRSDSMSRLRSGYVPLTWTRTPTQTVIRTPTWTRIWIRIWAQVFESSQGLDSQAQLGSLRWISVVHDAFSLRQLSSCILKVGKVCCQYDSYTVRHTDYMVCIFVIWCADIRNKFNQFQSLTMAKYRSITCWKYFYTAKSPI